MGEKLPAADIGVSLKDAVASHGFSEQRDAIRYRELSARKLIGRTLTDDEREDFNVLQVQGEQRVKKLLSTGSSIYLAGFRSGSSPSEPPEQVHPSRCLEAEIDFDKSTAVWPDGVALYGLRLFRRDGGDADSSRHIPYGQKGRAVKQWYQNNKSKLIWVTSAKEAAALCIEDLTSVSLSTAEKTLLQEGFSGR
jgi:hypothetical protein